MQPTRDKDDHPPRSDGTLRAEPGVPSSGDKDKSAGVDGAKPPLGQRCVSSIERDSAGERLKASEVSYRRLFEAARDGILILDAETGQITDVNPFLVELLGFSHSEIVGKTVGELSPFRDVVSHQDVLVRLQREGCVRYDDLPLRTKDGRSIEVEFISNVYQAGNRWVIQCNIRDMTARRQAEESNARLAMAVEQAAETIVITDTDGAILYANPAFEKTTGYTLAEALGQNPRILKSGKQDAELYLRMWETLRRGESWSGHFINKRKDGTLYEEEATISPVRDAKGAMINYVAVKRDVTREMQLEAGFRQSQKMESIGQLAGGIAHDFNNILAVVMMQAELSLTVANTPMEVLEGLGEIRAAAERASNLTRQLLLFSRQQIMQRRVLDLNAVVTDLAKMLRRIIGENVSLELQLQTAPLLTHADAGMLEQVLMNLAVNSRDAMPRGGRLVIETAEKVVDAEQATLSLEASPGRFVWLSVSDTGCGIPPESMSRIFEPFFTTKEVGRGTGLGLATVFGIVKQHRGWIKVYSELGRGTCVQVFLPVSEESIGNVSAQKMPKPVARGGSETILLVEDDDPLRRLTCRLLERHGYHVLEAADGVEAEQVWVREQGRIALLLTDLVMPGRMDGRELSVRLQTEQPGLKVIFMSGYSAAIAGRNIELQIGQNFIQKPIPPDQLLRAIRRLLDP